RSDIEKIVKFRNLLLQLTNHEADRRIAGKGSGLEDALHNKRWNPSVNLQDNVSWELDPWLELSPQLALVLEKLAEFLNLLHAICIQNGSSASRRNAIDKDLSSCNGHHRSLDHVHRVAGVRHLDVLIEARRTRG